MELLEWLERVGGLATMQQARNIASRDEIETTRGDRTWTPLRGWIALTDVRDERTWALQHGGVASCVTSFARHGMWVPHGVQQLHIRVNRETHSDRVTASASNRGVVQHRMHLRLADRRPAHGFDLPLTALAVATGCISVEFVAAAAESAVARGLVTLEEVDELAAILPRRRRRGLEGLSAKSGSGTESILAALFRRAGISFAQQAELLPKEFFDFLIGLSLVVEVDSRSWHASPAQLANDRRRDAALIALGYRVVRFTYEQVMFEPEYCMATIRTLLQRDVHRIPPLPR